MLYIYYLIDFIQIIEVDIIITINSSTSSSSSSSFPCCRWGSWGSETLGKPSSLASESALLATVVSYLSCGMTPFIVCLKSWARCSGSHLLFWHFGRPRWEGCLRPGIWDHMGNIARCYLYKNTNIIQAWWWMPMVPATLKAEVGGLLEPGRWRLQWVVTESL